jgi:RNA polymerase sigma-B factor
LRHAASLDALSGPEPDGSSYGESLGADDDSYATVEYLDAISPVMRALPERERLILKLRFVDDLTQSEIATRIGVGQMHVSRLMRRSLDGLRTVADAT